MSTALVRQRSLLPMNSGVGLEGWMDEDAAAAAGQLFGSGPRGVLVIDARELLTSTARVVGVQLGELHFKAWMALITLHVAHRLLRALFDLRQAQFTVPGYDLVHQRPAAGVSDTSLLINLYVDELILKA